MNTHISKYVGSMPFFHSLVNAGTTHLLIVEFSVVCTGAGHPVFRFLSGLFEQDVQSDLHVCLIGPVVILQLPTQLLHGWGLQVSLHVGVPRLGHHLMRDLTGTRIEQHGGRRLNTSTFDIGPKAAYKQCMLFALLPQTGGCTL